MSGWFMSNKFPIYFFKMPSQYWLTSTFLRFQEYYESPKFRNLGFSLEEFQDWYVTTRDHGEFSYYADWAGFNFPSFVVDNFTPENFGKFSRKENWLLDTLKDAEGKFYVIGTASSSDDDSVINHELAHAFFYINEEYAAAARQILQGADFSAFTNILFEMGYCSEVLDDEIVAYMMTGLTSEMSKVKPPNFKEIKRLLLENFQQKIGFNLSDEIETKKIINEKINLIDGNSIVTQ